MAAASGTSIEVRDLKKDFGSVHAVRGLTFTVQPGRVTGFLGPNGAGKTTTLRIILGLVAASSGSATVGGRRYFELDHPVHHLGAVLEATSFHPARKARAHLTMMTMAAGLARTRVDEVLDLVGLTAHADRKVGGYSMGMRQRLDLAGAMLGDPEVLILDEPSNGLDPQGIAWLREFLRHLASEGRTILVSSHLLAEMAQTVDDVVIVSNGEVQAQGPLSSLTHTGASVRLRTPDVPRLEAVLGGQGLQVRPVAQDVVSVPDTTPEVLGPILAANQIVLYEMVAEGSTLESTFLELTAGLGLSPDGQPAPWVQPASAFVPPPPPGAPPAGSAPPRPPGAPPIGPA